MASPFEKGGTALGHWKAECPQRKDQAREQANVAHVEGEHHDEFPQVIVEELDEEPREGFMEMCFVAHSQNASVKHPFLSLPNRQKAVQFWSRRVSKFWQIHNKGGKGVNKHHNLRRDNQGPSPYALMPHASENSLPCHTTLSPMEMLEIGSNPKKDECFTSQVSPVQSKAHGLASLDTGASRSVIGIEHVPAVVQKLPVSVRQSIKECPSKVGFRFGNNQIAYSFKQLQIPLKQGKKRIPCQQHLLFENT